MIEHGEQPEGYVLLSHTRAARLRIWDNLEKAYQEQLVISGRVLGRVKGGLAVDVGIKAFMPGSQADPRPVHNLDSLIGQDIPVKIIKLNRRRGNVVVSRKMAVEEEINVRKNATLDHLAEGAVVTGVVKNLTDYGAFIDLGGIDGLLGNSVHRMFSVRRRRACNGRVGPRPGWSTGVGTGGAATSGAPGGNGAVYILLVRRHRKAT